MKNRYAVIMAGGRGERFWPQSRLQRPKHLLPIVGGKSMLTQTVERLEGLVPPERVIILTNREQREGVRESCPDVPAEQIVCEPVGRDTAPAVGLAKILVKHKDASASFAMLPADHVIHDAEKFRSVLSAAFEAAESEPVLTTIGIQPSEPATGFGYIHKAGLRKTVSNRDVFDVQAFVEKPNLDTAKKYVDSGEYFWNAGMFVWTVNAIESAFQAHAPELASQLNAMEQALSTGSALEDVLEAHFPNLSKISIDYAVMEKASNVVTLQSDFDWDDVDSWPAVANHHPHDAQDNVSIGDSIIQDGSGNIIINENGHLTALLGVDDLIVVQTQDATLICPKSRAQDVKKIVQQISQNPDWKSLT